jgi:hypothetical protein
LANLKGRDYWEELDIDGKVMLKNSMGGCGLDLSSG